MDTILNLFDPIFSYIPGYMIYVKPICIAVDKMIVDQMADPIFDIFLFTFPISCIVAFITMIVGIGLFVIDLNKNTQLKYLLFNDLPGSLWQLLLVNAKVAVKGFHYLKDKL